MRKDAVENPGALAGPAPADLPPTRVTGGEGKGAGDGGCVGGECDGDPAASQQGLPNTFTGLKDDA